MNKVEHAFYAIISADATIQGIVGVTPNDQIWPVVFPEDGTFPAIVYQLGPGSTNSNKGAVSGLETGIVQMKALSSDRSSIKGYDEAGDLIEAIRDALDGKSGTFGDVVIQHIEADGTPSDGFNEDGRSDGIFEKTQDFFYGFTRT